MEAKLTEANLGKKCGEFQDTEAVVAYNLTIMGVTGLWDVSTLTCQRGLTL